ncbi:MAG: tripartite tricarboxylate transporter substrate-binding protein [Proteobacteria bacterium]|nr:tripartite tricarboxylate transporter substrate-binding protein [Pseudomonadota bacterium]MDA1323377.1 tripartite tricarboxylate transporter substrate-binding protein [Pseudomonadota bacterium]
MARSILTGLTILTILAGTTLTTRAVVGQSIDDLYKDRTVTLLVHASAGGTYGQTAQLLSRHLGKKIPGNPNVIVQHMPGGGGMKASNYAYNVMPKNGHNIFMPPEMSVVSQLLRPKKVKFVINKFTWLGTVFGANQVMMVRRDTGIRSLGDLKKREIIVASTGTSSPTYLVPAMMNGILGTKFKIVTGYQGSAGTSLSIERGETFGMTNTWVSWKVNRGDWFDGTQNSYAFMLAQIGFTKEKELPNLPLLTELATNDDDRAAAAMLSTAAVIGRGLALPPGVPQSLINPLRTAFWNTVSDPAFKVDAERWNLPVIPIKGADLQKIINSTIAKLSPSAIATAKKYVFGK